jgi:hypothetical protein
MNAAPVKPAHLVLDFINRRSKMLNYRRFGIEARRTNGRRDLHHTGRAAFLFK